MSIGIFKWPMNVCGNKCGRFQDCLIYASQCDATVAVRRWWIHCRFVTRKQNSQNNMLDRIIKRSPRRRYSVSSMPNYSNCKKDNFTDRFLDEKIAWLIWTERRMSGSKRSRTFWLPIDTNAVRCNSSASNLGLEWCRKIRESNGTIQADSKNKQFKERLAWRIDSKIKRKITMNSGKCECKKGRINRTTNDPFFGSVCVMLKPQIE